MSYFPQVFALCCSWELFSACSGAAPLHCTQNQQLGQCRARLCSLGWHEVPGPLLMTSSWLSHAWPAGRAASRAAAHARLLLPLLSRHKSTPPPPHTHTRHHPRAPRRRQIIRDDFILITFCLIFFYRRGATPHWLRNIPQVGAGVRGWGSGSRGAAHKLRFVFLCRI